MSRTVKHNYLTDGVPHEEKQSVARNCGLCSHQKVCTIYAMFNSGIQPHIDKSIISVENLAWICKAYDEMKDQ